MCNPPFYASEAEIHELAAEKDFSPHSVCTGDAVETVTEGGERGFVERMVDESKLHGDQIRWFSSLLGKATSVRSIVEHLARLGCDNYALVEFTQAYTHRWVVAWSWTGARLPDAIARQLPPSSALTKSLPLPNTLTYIFSQDITMDKVRDGLYSLLQELDVRLVVTRDHQLEMPAADEGVAQDDGILVYASYVSWSRAARRARQRGEGAVNIDVGISPSSILVSSFLTSPRVSPTSKHGSVVEMSCSWLYGTDRHAFESLFTYTVRKLSSTASAPSVAAAEDGSHNDNV